MPPTKSPASKIAIVWLRRDLRLSDNYALQAALERGYQPLLVYIWDTDPKQPWPMGGAQKVWLHHSLTELQKDIAKRGGNLIIRHGKCLGVLKSLAEEVKAEAVFWQRLYEPYTIARDTRIKESLKEYGVIAHSVKGYSLVEPNSLKPKSSKSPYFRVFTPFWRSLSQHLSEINILLAEAPKALPAFDKIDSESIDSLGLIDEKKWGKKLSKICKSGEHNAWVVLGGFLTRSIANYSSNRDFPDSAATSNLSAYLHFGEISPFRVWHEVKLAALEHGLVDAHADAFLRQLAWRDFSIHLLFHYPRFAEKNFRSQFDAFPWISDSALLKAWQKGETGIPIVDAGMRELWHTGFMHNRVRMLVASFLTKNCLIHWKHGAAWFWDTLFDADLANNSAGWQWVAGSGADAAPYFRIFNPVLQAQKFDSQAAYIKKWVPELAGLSPPYIFSPWEISDKILADAGIILGEDYPQPVCDLGATRARALEAYDKIRNIPE